MSDAANNLSHQLDAVIDDEGNAIISHEQIERLGLRLHKGSHLSVVARPRFTLDEVLARGDAQRKAAGIPEMSDDEVAEFADGAVKEVRQRIYAEGSGPQA